MSEDSMLMCFIAFVLGYLVARMTSGNGLSVGGEYNRVQYRPTTCRDFIENLQSI